MKFYQKVLGLDEVSPKRWGCMIKFHQTVGVCKVSSKRWGLINFYQSVGA